MALRSGCALEPVTDSKYLVGLGAAGLTPPGAPNRVEAAADPAMPAGAIVRAELRRRLDQWTAHEPGARLGDDPEHLHDLRVAGWRIVATLRLFRDYLPRRMVRLRERVRKLLRVLGAARDLDVQVAALEAMAADLPEGDREALRPAHERLVLDRERARRRMLAALDASRTQLWLRTLEGFLADESASGQRSGRLPAALALPRLIRRRFKKLRRAAAPLTAQSPLPDFHRARGQQ